MKQTWFTCSRCGHQFKGTVNHNHHCPRCNHYPSLVGKVRLQAQQPRVTRQFPPPSPSGTLPQFTNSDQPTQPGQFTQAGWPSQTPPQAARPQRAQRPSFSSYSLPVRVTTIMVMVGIVACLCGGIAYGVSQITGGSATPTPGIAQTRETPTTATSQTSTMSPSPTPTKKPTPKPTPKPPTPTPKPSCPHPAVNNNPWCYTFTNTGKLIYNPPGDFCSYFPCIGSFGNSAGYVVECADGDYSTAGGISGACSHHGGVHRPLYAP